MAWDIKKKINNLEIKKLMDANNIHADAVDERQTFSISLLKKFQSANNKIDVKKIRKILIPKFRIPN